MTGKFSELLLFQVGARVFASAVADVVRVGGLQDVTDGALVEETSLGQPFGRTRGLVVADRQRGTEATLVVDQVLGVRQVAEADLHPVPAFAAAVLSSSALAGLVLFDDAPTLIVDLPTLIRERLVAAAA